MGMVYAEEIEGAVLGACLLERSAQAVVLKSLRAEMFYLTAHRVVFEAINALYARGAAVDMLTVTEELRAKGLLGLLIVDYLQLLATVNPGRTREQEVAECSRKLKGLARSLGCPVIVSSQLNRQAEDRAGSPELRHLRESGAIEQDADLVILLHRPERYHIRVDPDTGWSTRGMGIATVAKHRNGATGKVYYGYNPSMTKIGEFAGTSVTAPANNLKRKEDERKSSDLFGGSAG